MNRGTRAVLQVWAVIFGALGLFSFLIWSEKFVGLWFWLIVLVIWGGALSWWVYVGFKDD